MKAYALLGGPKSEWPKQTAQLLTDAQKTHDLLIGVDRGCLLMEEMKIVPTLAVGDFDSLKLNELAQIERTVPDIRYSNPIKWLTDSELMIRIAFTDYHVDQLILLGATGGRLDHLLINLTMMLNPQMRPYINKIFLLDKQNLVSFYGPGKHYIKRAPGYRYFGISCLSGIKNLQIEEARYPLKDYSNSYPVTLASNEFLPNKDRFVLTFSKGIAAVIQSCDIDRYQEVSFK